MSPLIGHKLIRILKYALVTQVIAAIFITFSPNQDYNWLQLFYLLLGAWTGFLQEFVIGDRLRKLAWIIQIIVQVLLVNIVTMGIVIFIYKLDLDPDFNRAELDDMRIAELVIAPDMLRLYRNVFIVTAASIAFFQLETLVGRYTFPKYLFGQYDKPVREELVCMFMDIRDSTTITEKLGDERYFEFLNDTLFLMTDPALSNKAEILKYIGDEVVFTWSMKRGLKNANCIKIYFDILEQVEKNREMFEREYGVVPQFRAGVHCGHVITAMIGHLKKGIDHSGDAMNTTARIAGVCSPMNAELIASKELMDRIKEVPENLRTVPLGEISLKGKEKPMELIKIERRS